MRQGIEDMITRQTNAFDRLVECISTHDVSEEVAVKIAKLYLKEKIAKLNPNSGQFTIKHGAFFDDAVIANAVEMVTA